jgi:hypothetical protein
MATTRGAYESFNTNGFETRLTTEASAIDTVFYLQTTQGLTSPFYMVIDPEDTGQREYIFIDGNVTSTSVEIANANQDNRYLEGSGATSGLTHTAGTTVRLAPTLQHFEDLWDAIGQVVDVDFTSANAGQVNFDATEALADVATDKVFFKDSSDSNNLKKESIADIVTNIAGTGLTATSGVLSVDEATSLKGDIKAENDTVILDNGTDGTDATFTGDVTGDVTGNVTGDITSSGISDFSGSVDFTGATLTGITIPSDIDDLSDVDTTTTAPTTGATFYYNGTTWVPQNPVLLKTGAVAVNVNGSGWGKRSIFNTTPAINYGGFTLTSNEITIPEDGLYQCSFAIFLSSTVQRAVPGFAWYVNNVSDTSLGIAAHTYIRSAAGTDYESSANHTEILELTANDVLSIYSLALAVTGTVNSQTSWSNFTVMKIGN